jgi:hypothetical protein
MVPFAIGSETAGSITYPATRCGVTALRPTFGTVGRTGVMSISESLVVPQSSLCVPLLFFLTGVQLLVEFTYRLFTRTNLAHSVEAPQIAPLFWMLFGVGIQMIPRPVTVPLMTHSWLTSPSLPLDILMMLRWRSVVPSVLL